MTSFTPLDFTVLAPAPGHLLAATPGPDLPAHGYTEVELRVRGEASSWTGPEIGYDGHVDARPAGRAPFATRVLVRRPSSLDTFSGTVLVEWLNVSSGEDAAPDWTYLAEEVVRRGHVWVGVSAQFIGVEGGASAVGDLAPDGDSGLRHRDPGRYGDLHHPGDAFSYSIFAAIASALTDPGAPLPGWPVRTLLAIGESQSAFALTTFINAVQPQLDVFDGFLVHSRGGAALGWGAEGRGFDLTADRGGPPVRIRTDLAAKVITVQTETEVVTPRFAFLSARQEDGPTFRLWEVAGTAHADRWQIGEFEELLGCPDPVNRGQQAYVLRAAVRALEAWCREGAPPAQAPRLSTGPTGALVLDEIGNALGGVRTPIVEAPTELLSGVAAEGSSIICALFGRTLPAPAAALADRYRTVGDYKAAYRDATDAAISAGFILVEDRDAVLDEARPDLIADR